MKRFSLFIPTEPVPQARPRSRLVYPQDPRSYDDLKARSWIQVYEPAACRKYKNRVKQTAYNTLIKSRFSSIFPLDIPLVAGFTFYITRPKSVTRAVPSVKPDLDNYIKAVVDGLTGVVWRDDAVIVQYGENTKKLYVGTDGVVAPGVQVVVTPYGLEEFPNTQESLELLNVKGGEDAL